MRLRASYSVIIGLLLTGISGVFAKELPKVLFIGDYEYRQIGAAVSKDLQGQAKIVFPKNRTENSGSTLELLDEVIGKEKWKVIFFNFGHGDLFYKDPATKEIRTMSKHSGGVRVSSAEQYKKNLEAIVTRLKKTGARIVWGTTTPMVNVNSFPNFRANVFDANSEREYNAIALKVMSAKGVAVCDLHSFVMSHYGPKDKHPGYNAYQKDLAKKKVSIQAPMVEAISKVLR